MRICFFLGGFTGAGGIGRVTSVLSNTLAKNEDHEIYALSYSCPKKPAVYQLDENVRQDFLLPTAVGMKNAILQGAVGKLVKYLKQNQIEVLIACGSLFFPISIVAAKKTGVKVICWEHTAPDVVTDHAFQMQSRVFGARRSSANVLITRAAKEEYDSKIAKKRNNLTIYNPIDEKAVAATREYNKDSRRIISVGRLTYPKNYEQLLSVANKVLSKHPDWEWDIYGDGEQYDQLTEIIRGYRMENRIHLKGQVSDIYDRYRDYSFKVLLSRYEGFPMTLLEASANGLPMVSFDVRTGPNEIIEDGKNGYLLPFGDEDAAVKAIETLVSNEELRVSMAAESRQTAENFKHDKIVAQWNELFDSL